MTGEDKTGKDRVEPQGDEAEMMARLQEEIRNLPVGEHVVYMLHSLSALAIGHLGLTPDTAAQRDLDQARLAIEAFRALVGVLEPVRPSGEMTVHRGMLSQMQLAYAAAMDRGAPAEPAAAAAAPVAEAPPEPAPAAEPTAEPEPAAVPKPAPAAEAEAPSADAPPKPRKPRKSSAKSSE